MTARLLYRLTAALFVIFALGHTYGFLSLRAPSPEGAAVRDAMDRVHFLSGLSWGGFYVMFGLDISLYLLFSAVVAWSLGDFAERAPGVARLLAWSFLAVQLGGLVLALLYVQGAPVIFSVIMTACVGVAIWRTPPATSRAGVTG
jgi:hypothetical protein